MFDYDFENMPLDEMIKKISEVKELLAYCNDEILNFPYNAYFQGSECLRQAITFLDDMLLEEQRVKDMISKFKSNHPYSRPRLEYDSDGRCVGVGSDEEYDTNALDVMNGDGYYDENGNYVSKQT